MTRQVVKFWCSCGAAGHASSVPPTEAKRIIDTMRGAHLKDGHREVNHDEYERIRARQRREDKKEHA